MSYSQNALNFSLHQDLKLLAIGDNRGNDAGTINFVARIKYEGKDNSLGYFVYGLEYENAFLTTKYTRYAAFTGFTFMDIFNDYNLQVTPSVGIGNIHRENTNLLSFSASLQLEYFLSERVRLSFLNQITERSDLEFLYGKLEYRYSFFFGIEIQLFKFKPKY
ncbi:hypothetical protein FDT66_01255 [Polaribacter aestuariivivens]|uniref:Outer membrane protein beta-barrel domain-containing protein n=1 Tax=Polaribacter aestuariivivens TaxID=2304626 RepID=A0A5S3NA03_9FLAO|nr:hypothetical protein [Polaribacter aestuariivivens]TMM32121.1 hypothetical protein FDT66_01255 [Polaribacter aestuariivivens]